MRGGRGAAPSHDPSRCHDDRRINYSRTPLGRRGPSRSRRCWRSSRTSSGRSRPLLLGCAADLGSTRAPLARRRLRRGHDQCPGDEDRRVEGNDPSSPGAGNRAACAQGARGAPRLRPDPAGRAGLSDVAWEPAGSEGTPCARSTLRPNARGSWRKGKNRSACTTSDTRSPPTRSLSGSTTLRSRASSGHASPAVTKAIYAGLTDDSIAALGTKLAALGAN